MTDGFNLRLNIITRRSSVPRSLIADESTHPIKGRRGNGVPSLAARLGAFDGGRQGLVRLVEEALDALLHLERLCLDGAEAYRERRIGIVLNRATTR